MLGMRIFVADQLAGIFDEADQHNHAGANETGEEEYLKEAHSVDREGHGSIVA